MDQTQSEAEAIQKLGKLLEEANRNSESASTEVFSNACVYQAGGKTYCADLTKAQCDVLKGTHTAGGKCP